MARDTWTRELRKASVRPRCFDPSVCVKLLSFALIPKTDSVSRSGTVGFRVSRSLKTRDRALPPQTCTLGCFGMSVHSAYKVVCKVYSAIFHLEHEPDMIFSWLLEMFCSFPVVQPKLGEFSSNKFDTIKHHVFTKLCEKSQASEMTVAYMAEMLKGSWPFRS